MEIIAYCLATFILTLFIICIRLNTDYEIVSKDKIENSKYLTFENGYLFKKVESEKEWKQKKRNFLYKKG